ncbi:MAG: sensor histidine kinase [Candidatus Dormibacteraceae bacterium]
MSGAITWALVRSLEVNSARVQLSQSLPRDRTLIGQYVQACQGPPSACAEQGMTAIAPRGPADRRLLLVGPDGVVRFDSWGTAAGQQLLVPAPTPRREGDVTLEGESYLAAAAAYRGGFLVLAQPVSSLAGATVSSLLPRLVIAALIALAFALGAALLVGRAMTRRLSALAGAAEDIGAGNYARRVEEEGTDEIGVVGEAFNRMAGAVERSRRLQRDFLANASHELKTPLTSLIGFSQALIDGSLGTKAEQRRAAIIIHEEAERVLRLSQELLDLARVESGQAAYHLQAVDMAVLFKEEAELHRQRTIERRLALEFALPEALPPVEADPDRLHQIVANLLDNAVKYAPEGSTVRVAARPAGDEVEAAVSNPVGAHAPDPERMFDRFYRADPSRSSATVGVGLGLAICKELAEAQSGRLWAELSDGMLSLRLRLPRSATV